MTKYYLFVRSSFRLVVGIWKRIGGLLLFLGNFIIITVVFGCFGWSLGIGCSRWKVLLFDVVFWNFGLIFWFFRKDCVEVRLFLVNFRSILRLGIGIMWMLFRLSLFCPDSGFLGWNPGNLRGKCGSRRWFRRFFRKFEGFGHKEAWNRCCF